MPLFRSRQQQQQEQKAEAAEQPLRNNVTTTNCAASLEGLLEVSSSSTVSLSASGLCRCGLGGEEVHSVQVSR